MNIIRQHLLTVTIRYIFPFVHLNELEAMDGHSWVFNLSHYWEHYWTFTIRYFPFMHFNELEVIGQSLLCIQLGHHWEFNWSHY